MSRRNKNQPPPPKSIDDLGKEKAREKLADARAIDLLAGDPGALADLIRQKATEQAIGMAAAQQAAREQEIEKKGKDREALSGPPWGIPFLATPHTLGAIHKRISQRNALGTADSSTAEQREQELTAAVVEARRETLGLGGEVAGLLAMHGIEPDTVVYGVTRGTHKKLVGPKVIYNKGVFTKPIEDIEREHVQSGWLLNVAGPKKPASYVVLCADGRIFGGYGSVTESPDGSKDFEYSARNTHGDANARYLNEDLASDIAGPLFLRDNLANGANQLTQRAHHLQEAIVATLVENGVSLPEAEPFPFE